MYTLTLTRPERAAIDWIGDRYSHGHDLYLQLCRADWGDAEGWDDQEPITFTMMSMV